MPGIKTASLLSTGVLEDNNYISIFDKEGVMIYDAKYCKITTLAGPILLGY